MVVVLNAARTGLRRRHVVLAAALPACGLAAAAAGAPAPLAVGDVLPAVTLRGLNGPDRLLSSYAGRRLLVNVWASWCGPCKAEAASLERYAWSDAGRHCAVIGISTDDDRRQAERWLRQSNATISHFIDQRLELERLLGAQRIPLTVLVAADGRVAGRIEGAREWDDAATRRLVDTLFAARTPQGSMKGFSSR